MTGVSEQTMSDDSPTEAAPPPSFDDLMVMITNSLHVFATSVAGGAFVDVAFTLVPTLPPDYSPGDAWRWEHSVRLKCLVLPSEADAQNKVQYDHTWEATGTTPHHATANLLTNIREHLQRTHACLAKDAELAGQALALLGGPEASLMVTASAWVQPSPLLEGMLWSGDPAEAAAAEEAAEEAAEKG